MDDTSTPLKGKHKVFVNGDWVGVCEDSHAFAAELRNLRRRGELPLQVLFTLSSTIKLVSGDYYLSLCVL